MATRFEATGMTDGDYAKVELYDRETGSYRWFVVDDLMRDASIDGFY